MRERKASITCRILRSALWLLPWAVTATFPAISRAQDVVVPLTVTITKLVQVGPDFDDSVAFPSLGDFYARVTIDGVPQSNFDDQCDLPPKGLGGFFVPSTLFAPGYSRDECPTTPWVFSRDINITAAGSSSVPVRIEILDDDALGASDTGDADPGPGKVLDLVVSTTTGTYTGDVEWPGPHCAKGGGGDAVEICWEIGPDSDGDGLVDVAEEFGMDTDNDGVIDFDLPGLGADPLHKDLFVELDWMPGRGPSQASIQAVKEAFANAPIDAGGTPNPDGQPGIRVWFDTGDLTDPFGTEDGGALGALSTCSDGIDNGGDGLTDLDDPDCLVGDNLGGGNEISADPEICRFNQVGAPFYFHKAANFDAAHRGVAFRYGIFPQLPCPDSPGGQAERGGNDLIVFNSSPRTEGSTLMHELGHNLNLGHGGGDNNACKPNYVSVMNYDHQGGIDNLVGPAVLDYSPPRFPGGRGRAPLDDLVEEDLDETLALDPTDPANLFVFARPDGGKVLLPLSAPVDWDGDGATVDFGLAVNIDTSDIVTGLPEDCTNSEISDAGSPLKGHDDWTNISLSVGQFGDASDAPVNLVETPEPTTEEILAHKESLNTADLSITKTADSGPIEVGTETELIHALIVTNNGHNPALALRVVDTLPPGASFVASTDNCEEILVGTIVCESGPLLVGENRQIDITIATAGTCVDGIPIDIVNTATVANIAQFAGSDPGPDDNEATATTTVVDTTPPNLILSAALSSLWPPRHQLVDVGLNFETADVCDPDLEVSIIVTSDEPTATAAGAGGPQHAPDAEITADGRVLLRAERSGEGDGRVYVIEVIVTDASDNSVSSSVAVGVNHSRNVEAVDSGQGYDATQIN